MNHFGKAGFVETPGVIMIIALLFGPLAVVIASEYLSGLYRLLVRRYERSLDDTYAINFQTRSIEARTLDANVGYALKRAKRTVDEVRKNSPDELRVRVALGQVSGWLDSAAEKSDRALRSLENEKTQTIKSQVGIFTKDDLDS